MPMIRKDKQCIDCNVRIYDAYLSTKRCKSCQEERTRLRNRISNRKYRQKPEVKAKRCEENREYMRRPEVREAHLVFLREYNQRPDVKERRRICMQKYHHKKTGSGLLEIQQNIRRHDFIAQAVAAGKITPKISRRVGLYGELYITKLQVVKIYGKTIIQEYRTMIPADTVEDYILRYRVGKTAKIVHAFDVLRKHGTGATKHTVRALLSLDGTEVTDSFIAMVAKAQGLQQRRENGTVFYDTSEAIGRSARIVVPVRL